MTLHEAMIKAINELGGGKQHIQDVTDYINTHRLYSTTYQSGKCAA